MRAALLFVSSGCTRDRAAALLAVATILCLVAVFTFTDGRTFLMPGRLSSAHGTIETCQTCHTKSGSGRLSWLHGLVSGDRRADSDACLSCHKMPDTAFNPHGARRQDLEESTERLARYAARSSAPAAARAQSIAFPAERLTARGLSCATCHQEHQGAGFELGKLTNEKCQSCHAAKFDSFDGHHPEFDRYPFSRRTRIVYDHDAHFTKHFPEVAKKEPTKPIPATCSICHVGSGDKRTMGLAPFDTTCGGCHLNQIKGKERATGPKGIAFLAAPGLDLETLRSRKAAIGEWPEDSEAALTPFMKLLIGRTEHGRTLIASTSKLNLQNLSGASDANIKAVTDLVWETKRLFYALLSDKGADALAAVGARTGTSLPADLTASIPREVIAAAQQQWLPNLAAEIANGPGARLLQPPPARQIGNPVPPAAPDLPTSPNPAAPQTTAGASPAEKAEKAEPAAPVKRDPPACVVRLFGQCLLFKGDENKDSQTGAAGQAGGGATRSGGVPPPAFRAGLTEIAQAANGGATPAQAKPSAAPKATSDPAAARTEPPAKPGGQRDELLFATEEEQRQIDAHHKQSGKTLHRDQPRPSGSPPQTAASADGQPNATATTAIDSSVDAERWAEHGGWYRQDHAVYYRPAGHKDRFFHAWLALTGPLTVAGAQSPPAAVFEALAGKDAPGSCTKCHSIDHGQGGGALVNFSPLTGAMRESRFTRFIHEPHFGIVDDRGCLGCHELGKDRQQLSGYLKSYEQRDPSSFASQFEPIKKKHCETCHTSGVARQDCMLCHKYHVNDPVSPVTGTKNPMP